MRTALAEDPAVIAIAFATKLDTDRVVGKLHRIWSWADKNTIDGRLSGVPSEWIDAYVNKKGFAAAMAATEPPWLLIDQTGVTIPKFDRHNGASAKSRAENTDRVRLSREKRDTKRTRARPEKRREENSSSANAEPPLPPVLDNDEFKAALSLWLTYKTERREFYKPSGLQAMVSLAARRAGEHSVKWVIDSMERARANDWKGWDQKSNVEIPIRNLPPVDRKAAARAAARAEWESEG